MLRVQLSSSNNRSVFNIYPLAGAINTDNGGDEPPGQPSCVSFSEGASWLDLL